MDQFLIKVLLISSLIFIGLQVSRKSGSDKKTAFRRIFIIFFLIVASLAILFPETLSSLAALIGVGRGTDLLLYLLIIVYIGHLLSNARQKKLFETQITKLARIEAINSARAPGKK